MSYRHSDDERRIRRAIGNMPGGSSPTALAQASQLVGFSSRVDHEPVPITIASVADYLEALISSTKTAYQDFERDRVELRELKNALAGFARIMNYGRRK